ncbi:MAG: glutamate-1-semialdehyde 2,1-aminomutase [Clostridia bacterium]|nr:glutamate-1-semialdehyde 2,1-aminomutase [Clostridia bacterium]
MKFDQSKALFEEACNYIPGGVNSPVRAFGSVGMAPIFAKESKGSKLIDVDGNEYIDYICSWGPMLLGHSSDIAYQGILEMIQKGTSYGIATEIEIDMAKEIIHAYPSVELLRMVNSGTEATMSALRVARGYTKRDKIIKFEGCYHGHGDALLVKAGSGAMTFGVPTSSGVTAGTVKDTIVVPYNDLEAVKRAVEENKDEIAAVIIEPIAGNMGVVPADESFIHGLRKLTEDEGIILIFDEVITGFRVNYGGAQKLFGITPDMTTFGKIIGGGLPVGAYGGKKEIMSCVSPLGGVYQAGTLSGNPIALSMGLNVMRYLRDHQEHYDEIEMKAIRLEEGYKKCIQETGIKATVTRFKGMLCLFFTDGAIKNYDDVIKSDTELYARYFRAMLQKGILLPPAQFEGLFLSTAHSNEEIDYTIQATREVFESLVK